MSYAIAGFGPVGQALATMFARKGMNVSVASRRPPAEHAAAARKIGPTVTATSLDKALEADTILLAIPFGAHREVAETLPDWQGKTVIDVTNAYGIPVEDLDGLPSSVVISRAFPGARFAKAFNHLPAGVLAQDPAVKGGRRVIFVASDDKAATASVAGLTEKLGFAPVDLGKLDEGGALVQARGGRWTQLIFQDFIKFD